MLAKRGKEDVEKKRILVGVGTNDGSSERKRWESTGSFSMCESKGETAFLNEKSGQRVSVESTIVKT